MTCLHTGSEESNRTTNESRIWEQVLHKGVSGNAPLSLLLCLLHTVAMINVLNILSDISMQTKGTQKTLTHRLLIHIYNITEITKRRLKATLEPYGSVSNHIPSKLR